MQRAHDVNLRQVLNVSSVVEELGNVFVLESVAALISRSTLERAQRAVRRADVGEVDVSVDAVEDFVSRFAFLHCSRASSQRQEIVSTVELKSVGFRQSIKFNVQLLQLTYLKPLIRLKCFSFAVTNVQPLTIAIAAMKMSLSSTLCPCRN